MSANPEPATSATVTVSSSPLRPKCSAVHPTSSVRCEKNAGHTDSHRFMSWDAQESLQWPK